ncbi:MAG: NlpC/P60 family protein [bacterium]|nr:NlpC/P60 family protein [bacterium]
MKAPVRKSSARGREMTLSDAALSRSRRVRMGGAAAVVLLAAIGALAPVAGRAFADSDSRPTESTQAKEVGGGREPGRAPDREEPEVADAAPPPTPGFVDGYARLWTAIERGQARVKVLRSELATAQQSAEWAAQDALVALRERNESAFLLTGAAGQCETAVRSLYITGSTDLDVVLSVLGSEPDDVLRNIDSLTYLKGATGNESYEFEQAQQHAVVGESLEASAQIQADQALIHARSVGRDLRQAKAKLASDQADLAELVASATPQTVVGKSGCPKSVLEGTLPAGISVGDLCERAVKNAPTPQAAVAIKWALTRLGAPYACGGVGRLEPWRFDCSSYVSRAYSEGAGLGTAGEGWAPSTRNMVPWDGAGLDQHYAPIDPADLQPGDLVLYDTCPVGEVCTYRHVAMYLGPAEAGGMPVMAQTNQCGGVAHVAPFPGTAVSNFLGARRVVALSGEAVTLSIDVPEEDRSQRADDDS